MKSAAADTALGAGRSARAPHAARAPTGPSGPILCDSRPSLSGFLGIVPSPFPDCPFLFGFPLLYNDPAQARGLVISDPTPRRAYFAPRMSGSICTARLYSSLRSGSKIRAIHGAGGGWPDSARSAPLRAGPNHLTTTPSTDVCLTGCNRAFERGLRLMVVTPTTAPNADSSSRAPASTAIHSSGASRGSASVEAQVNGSRFAAS